MIGKKNQNNVVHNLNAKKIFNLSIRVEKLYFGYNKLKTANCEFSIHIELLGFIVHRLNRANKSDNKAHLLIIILLYCSLLTVVERRIFTQK